MSDTNLENAAILNDCARSLVQHVRITQSSTFFVCRKLSLKADSTTLQELGT